MAVNISFDPSWGLGLMADAQARRYEYNYRDKADSAERGLRRELAGMDDTFRREELAARVRDAEAGRTLQGQDIASREKVGLASAAAQQTSANAQQTQANAIFEETKANIRKIDEELRRSGVDRETSLALSMMTAQQVSQQRIMENRIAAGMDPQVARDLAEQERATGADALFRSPEIARALQRVGIQNKEQYLLTGGVAGNYLDELYTSIQARGELAGRVRDGQKVDEATVTGMARLDQVIKQATGGILEVRDNLADPATRAAIQSQHPSGISIFRDPTAIPPGVTGISPFTPGTDSKQITGNPQTGEQVRLGRERNMQNAALTSVAEREGLVPFGVESATYLDALSSGVSPTSAAIGGMQEGRERSARGLTPEGQLKAVNDARELSAARAGGSYEDAGRRRAPINAVFKQISPEGTRVNGFEDRWGESIFRNGQTPDEWNQNFVSDVEQTERENRAEMQALAAEFGITDPNSPEYWDLAARATWESRKGDIKNSWLGGWLSNPMPGQENVSTLGKLNAELVRNRWRQGLRGVSTVNSRKPWQ